MKNILKILITILVAVITIGLLPFYINLLTNNEDVIRYANSLGFFRLTVIVGVMVFLGVVLTVWLSRSRDTETTEFNQEGNIEPDVRKFYDSLKARYAKRFESKLDGRFEIPLEVSENWHSDKPKSYKFDAEAKVSDAVEAVRKTFHEKGRLLIVGSPGSGKTVLLLKLARELLGEEYHVNQKLPVIFNLASWSSTYTSFEDWLIDVLNSGNGLSKEFAKTVLRDKRLIFLLDGLDELARNEDSQTAHEKRAKCLDSLNDFLREGRQAVICCRRGEFAEMQKTTNQDAPVSAKVEVLDLTKADILLALQNAQKHNESRVAAEHLEKIIETNDAFLEVLSTPFYFTTALEVFDKSQLGEKRIPSYSGELRYFLITKFVESKITNTKNLTKFERDHTKIKKWFSELSKSMDTEGLVSFELANLQPDWLLVPRFYYLLLAAIRSMVFVFIFLIIMFTDLTGRSLNVEKFVIMVLAAFFPYSVVGIIPCFLWAVQTKKILPNGIEEFSFKSLFNSKVWVNIITSSLIWSGAFTTLFLITLNLPVILFIFLFILILVFCKRLMDSCFATKTIGEIKNNYQKLSSGLIRNTAKWISAVFLSIGIILSIYNRFPNSRDLNLIINFIILITVISLLGATLFKHLVLRMNFWLEGTMPLKYATFLDYAAEARILEKDGGQWRFRHQNLQEYFANLDLGEK